MKLAFTSSMLQQRFDSQPVWQRIQAEDPDYLVLLGNSIHLDIDADVGRMSANEFGEHAHALYRAQLAVPEFDALLRHMAGKAAATGGRRVFAIWDEHDYLWHGANGADMARLPEHEEKLPRSRALFLAFRQALNEIGSFPASFYDTEPPAPLAAAPLHESLPLQDGVWLHLTDGRSYRTATWLVPQHQRALLGHAQLATIAAALETATADAVHLVASGSASSDWKHRQHDWRALGTLAARHRLLMLSGTMRQNDFASHASASGWPLHEATSSGAAVRDAVIYGAELENFAIAQINPAEVRLRFFERDGETAPRHIARADWTLLPNA